MTPSYTNQAQYLSGFKLGQKDQIAALPFGNAFWTNHCPPPYAILGYVAGWLRPNFTPSIDHPLHTPILDEETTNHEQL